MKSVIILLSFILPFLPIDKSELSTNYKVDIEIIQPDQIAFDFSVNYKEIRKQIHVKSAEAIRSLKLSNGENKKKSYNTIGSNLVVLPIKDFTMGQSHFLEITFLDNEQTVLVNIEVTEKETEKSN